ncbi:MAG: MBL fold metallo-hydrolase [Parachlamydiales bacterium]|jgi:glyoxylase-like metal-dependent hydrolase (beta-lactamase superfamily II)
MILEKFVCGPLDNNTFLIVSEKTNKALVVDPSFGSYDKIAIYLKKHQCILEKILLTHFHWDHIADVLLLKNEFNPQVYIHRADAFILQNPKDETPSSLITIHPIKPDVLLDDNSLIDLSDIELLTIHTPGHTPGSSCFYIEKEKILFSGDTLFKGSYGRVDFEYSKPQAMIESLKKLSKLPEDVKVYPGHGNATTIGRENWMKNVEKFI